MLHALATAKIIKKIFIADGEQRLSKPSNKSKMKMWGKPAKANFWSRKERKRCVFMLGFLSIYLI